MWLFLQQESFSPVTGSGKTRKKKKTQFIVFCKCFKTPNGSKKKKEIKRIGFNTLALLEAPARQFIGVGENDVRPRVIQTRRIGGPGRG